MYCPFFLFASFLLCEVSAKAEPVEKIIKNYFNSESLQRFRKEWEKHRKPTEHALFLALQETVGVPGMNVYIRKMEELLATAYFHTDNQVRLILSELNHEEVPRCLLPDIQLSLASNVLKIQTSLSKIIIHANYTLIRNNSDIIKAPEEKNTLKTSPFLFEQVHEYGNVAITMESCTLSGFIMTILNGESVNLGYDHFRFYNCTYNLEIYRDGEDSPPVIAPYELDKENGLSLTHLLMKPLLTEELVPKLQAALFSFVNTSALFGKALQEYRDNQDIVFQATAEYFTDLIRKLNRITVEENNGAIAMEDYDMYWDEGRKEPSHNGAMKLMGMVLTGLDTMYSAHCGGPFKIETILMADEIRFSSLQVRGKIQVVLKKRSQIFNFSVEISDMVVDLQMGELQRDKGSNRTSKRDSAGFNRFEVTGLRRMIFAVPTLVFGPVESLISGYLTNEVPKLLKSHLSAIFSEAKSMDSENKVPTNASDSEDPIQRYEEGDKFFYFPGDGDNNLHRVDVEEPVDFELIERFTSNPTSNGYLLYTRDNPFNAHFIAFGDERSVAGTNFDFSKVTVFLAHGWLGDGKNKMNRMLTEAFLYNDDVNVIVLDWAGLAKSMYHTAKSGTAGVGIRLGKFVNWLVSFGLPYERVHLVGFSLGAHLVGNAGRATGGLVKRITALDPAHPYWGGDSNRVVATDAQYVEVIHTNTFAFGYPYPCGDADFYPNGGSTMPGCWVPLNINICSHSRSYEYMASSLKYNRLRANKCATLRDATSNTCTGKLNPMGNNDLTKSRSGIFRVNTKRDWPY